MGRYCCLYAAVMCMQAKGRRLKMAGPCSLCMCLPCLYVPSACTRQFSQIHNEIIGRQSTHILRLAYLSFMFDARSGVWSTWRCLNAACPHTCFNRFSAEKSRPSKAGRCPPCSDNPCPAQGLKRKVNSKFVQPGNYLGLDGIDDPPNDVLDRDETKGTAVNDLSMHTRT